MKRTLSDQSTDSSDSNESNEINKKRKLEVMNKSSDSNETNTRETLENIYTKELPFDIDEYIEQRFEEIRGYKQKYDGYYGNLWESFFKAEQITEQIPDHNFVYKINFEKVYAYTGGAVEEFPFLQQKAIDNFCAVLKRMGLTCKLKKKSKYEKQKYNDEPDYLNWYQLKITTQEIS